MTNAPIKTVTFESKIKFASKPIIPDFPVGDENYGIVWLDKLYDLTAPEHEFLKLAYAENEIKDQLEATVDFAKGVVKNHNENLATLSQDDLKQLASLAVALDEEEEPDELKKSIKKVRLMAKKILEEKAPLELETVVSRLLKEDQELILSNYFGVVQWTKTRDEKEKLRKKIQACCMIKFRVVDDPRTFGMDELEEEIKNGVLHWKVIEGLADYCENERTNWTKQDANAEIAMQELKKRLNKLRSQEKKSIG